jgi:hypothetical protein
MDMYPVHKKPVGCQAAIASKLAPTGVSDWMGILWRGRIPAGARSGSEIRSFNANRLSNDRFYCQS